MPKVTKKQLAELLAAAQPPSTNGHAPAVTTNPDGTLAVTWPEPRPASFTISAEAFDQLVTLINARTKTVIAARDLFAKLGTLGQSLGTGIPTT